MCGCFFLEAGLGNESEIVAKHQKDEQRQGERDAYCQRLHRAIGFAFVANEIEHRRRQAHDYDDKENDDDDAHKDVNH